MIKLILFMKTGGIFSDSGLENTLISTTLEGMKILLSHVKKNRIGE